MRAFLLSLLLVASANAATLYCGPAATGSGNGSNFSNLLQLPTTTGFTRGNVYVCVEGSYGGRTFSTATSGSSTITVRKASTADSAVTGYSTALFDGQAVLGGDLFIHTGYWIIDGVTGGGPSSWQSGHGFKCDSIQIISSGFDINVAIPGGNIILRHIETSDSLTPSSTDAISANSLDGLTISHVYTHTTSNCPVNLFMTENVTWEYSCHGEFASSEEHHAEIAFIYGHGNVTIQYNLFRWAESTGGLMINNPDGEEVLIHGNIFYRAAGETWAYGGDGLIGGWSNRADLSCHDVKVYNNTFVLVDDEDAGGNCAAVIGSTPHSGLEFKNNLFYLSDSGLPNGAWTADYNHYVNSGSESESNGTTASGNPFTDYTNLDFSLTANTTAGQDLGAPYNVDMFGNTRTTWTRGAIEFTDGEEEPGGPVLTISTFNIGN